MNRTRPVLVACRISRSGFSGERVFQVSRADGEEYVGVAPVHYFLTTDSQRLPRDAAIAPGEEVEGRILALLVASEKDEATVVFPGGELTRVKFDEVDEPSAEVASDVLV
jgi:hypothetical protein